MEKSLPIIFFVTTPNEQTAVDLAKRIVERKIAACTNIIPKITSIYWWEEKIHTETEYLMIIKTTQLKSEELITFIHKHHPYEVPECIGLPITKGFPPYLQWIVDSTKERKNHADVH